MSEHYIRGDVVCLPLKSREWHDYCEYLTAQLAELEEQKRNIEIRIAEIHRTLHPEVIGIEEDENEDEKSDAEPENNDEDLYMFEPDTASVEEKYLLPEDIASRYNIAAESVINTARDGRIPCHRINSEWRFTQSDVEQISSKYARDRYLFHSKKNSQARPTVIINKKPQGTLSSGEVCSKLGCTYQNYVFLKSKGLLNGRTIDGRAGTGNPLYYDENEVEALKAMINADGGIKSFIEKAKGDKAV